MSSSFHNKEKKETSGWGSAKEEEKCRAEVEDRTKGNEKMTHRNERRERRLPMISFSFGRGSRVLPDCLFAINRNTFRVAVTLFE
jgi:hypothetical protein